VCPTAHRRCDIPARGSPRCSRSDCPPQAHQDRHGRRARSRNVRCRYRPPAPADNCSCVGQGSPRPRRPERPESRTPAAAAALARDPHIDPDHSGALRRPVRLGLDFGFDVFDPATRSACRGSSPQRRISSRDRCSGCRLLVAAEEQRRAAMGAAMIHHSDPARAVAKCRSASHRATSGEAARRRAQAPTTSARNPVFPHQSTHDGTRADPCQLNAIDCRCHRVLLGICGGQPPTRGSNYIRL